MESAPNHNTGDVTDVRKQNSQDSYYKFKLMREKLELQALGDDSQVKRILGQLSEKEQIQMGILEKLMGIRESSPEYAQVCEITGSEDRFEQAERLAEATYKKLRAEKVLSYYTAPKDEVLSFIGRNVETGGAARGRATGIFGLPAAAAGLGGGEAE